MANLLELSGIDKIYGQHYALRGVDFSLAPGEVHCLVGENGAGKSTLIKILAGAVAPDSGTIRISGVSYPSLTPRGSLALGISTIYQDIELIESLTVADNIFLGHELSGGAPFTVNGREQERRAKELLDTLKIILDPGRRVEELATAQKQNLQIAKALHREARVLIMDEPTVALGLEEKKALMRLVRDLRDKGLGIIYISHFLEEVFEIGDRVTILKDGELVNSCPVADITVDQVIHQMVGRDASQFFSRERIEIGSPRLVVDNLSCAGLVENVSFSVGKGEIFGLGGLVGSGRTEVLELLFGARRRTSGNVSLDGKPIHPKSPREALAGGICLLTEDRKRLALFGGRSIVDNMAVAYNELFGGMLPSASRERRQAEEMKESLHIAMADPENDVMSLSGGNQQKVALARWLLSRAEVILLDEPTKGVDIGAKAEIYQLMVSLAKAGKSIVMVSSDMPELISMSDRIGVMRDGGLARILPAREAREEELIRYFMGA